MKKSLPDGYYNQQYNARAMVPDHPEIFTRWVQDSAHVRRTTLGLYDIAYGESSGERLDFFPANARGAPLLVFIHGGWWRALDKSDFSFLTPGFVRNGVNVAMTNYTLAPNASLQDITRQQLRALAWLYHKAEKYDFDPNRIVVAGHSAGAHLTAMMLCALWPVLDSSLPFDMVKAGIMLSGVYDLDGVRQADFLNVDLKLTESDVSMLSPARMSTAHPSPIITAVGGKESDEFKEQNRLIGRAWSANKRDDIALPDINHMTICDTFATPGSALHTASLQLIRSLP